MSLDMAGGKRDRGSSPLGFLVRSYPGQSLGVSVGFLISGLLEGIGVSTVLPLISLVVRGDSGSAGPLGNAVGRLLKLFGLDPSVGPLLALILAAFLLKAVLTYAAMRLAITTAAGIVMGTRREFLRSLLGTRWDFFQSQPAGRLGGAISHEAEQVADLYLAACRMVAGLIQVAIYIILAFSISWTLSLCALAVAGLGFAVLVRFIESMRKASTRFYERMRNLILGLVDALRGLKPLKAMGLEGSIEPNLEGDIRDLGTYKARAEMSRVALDVLREPFQLIMVSLGFYIAYRFLRIGFAEMALTLVIFTRIMDATSRLQSQHQQFARLEPAFHSVRSIMKDAEAWKENLAPGPRPEFRRDIRLVDVTFRRGSRVILDKVSLEIEAGRTTMLQGPSGAGKTTIVDLVAGLIKPESGKIAIDGVPLEEISLKAWRSMIGYVPQELFLFHGTILRNVTLGDPEIGREDVEAALRAAGAWDFIQALPEGLETVAGEGGTKLSGGQRQRIAIARALLRKPGLLILDEATSGLDPRTEEGLILSLKALKAPPAILVVSHRSAFGGAADVIYAVEKSRVARVDPDRRPPDSPAPEEAV